MQVKLGTLFAVCLVLGVLAGDASACINGVYDFKCTFGVVLRAWENRGGRCSVHSTLYRPYNCAGCTIYTGIGYIRVTTGSNTYTCSYGPGRNSACQAYCTTSTGEIAYNWYECFVWSYRGNPCSCSRSCYLNND